MRPPNGEFWFSSEQQSEVGERRIVGILQNTGKRDKSDIVLEISRRRIKREYTQNP